MSCDKSNAKCSAKGGSASGGDSKSEEKEEKKSAKKDKEKEEKVEGKCVGCIEHYYSHLGVGIVKLKDSLKKGDKIKIKGHTSDFDQTLDSMQVDHKDVEEAKKGDVIGIKVSDKVREDDCVYKVD